MDKYIIIGRDRMAYKRYRSVDIGVHPVFEVDRTIDYKKARHFRSLKWATFRARYLTKKDRQDYFVYLVIEVDGHQYFYNVDEHQNDDIHEANEKLYAELQEIIDDWKERVLAEQR